MLWTIAAAFFLAVVLANVWLWPRVRKATAPPERRLSVLIPARDEERVLPACLDAALADQAVAEVLVYDDHSSDRTRAVVQRYAARDPRVALLHPQPLPPGWCGKPFACSRLAEAASTDWLLFLDADARLMPGAAGRMRAEAEARGATLLSCWPGLDMGGFWERALMPLLNFVVFSLFPAPISLLRPDPSLGLAHGACILVRREVYRSLGGHSIVRGELFEDTRLARLWRERRERSLCLDGQDLVRVRMYSSLSGIWSGFQKNFYPAFRTPAAFWMFLTLHLVVFLGPFLTAQWTAAAMVLAMRWLLALRFRQPLWSPLLHPPATVFLLALGISSWLRCRSTGVVWKGRRYRTA